MPWNHHQKNRCLLADEFRTEVETQETLSKLQRAILNLESVYGKDTFKFMLTFSPDFQIKVDTYCAFTLYGNNHERTFMGWPWWSVMGQEEPYMIWREIRDK